MHADAFAVERAGGSGDGKREPEHYLLGLPESSRYPSFPKYDLVFAEAQDCRDYLTCELRKFRDLGGDFERGGFFQFLPPTLRVFAIPAHNSSPSNLIKATQADQALRLLKKS
jgi:hypothetical protein